MIGRIVRPADFERVLAAHQRSRSTHFAVHYLSGAPSRARASAVPVGSEPLVPGLSPELSTGCNASAHAPVDEPAAQAAETPGATPSGCSHWLGLVVPKRHAKRAVTRNLIKRQLREAMRRHGAALPPGLWVVRLRAPIDRTEFRSPASECLRESARSEIEQLFHQAAHQPLPPQARSGRRGGPRSASAKKAGPTAANPAPQA